MKTLLFLVLSTVSLSGCNFSPGAMLGDVNAGSDSNCDTRTVKASTISYGSGTCTQPPSPTTILSRVDATFGDLEIELDRYSEADRWAISELRGADSSEYGNIYYLTCTEDETKARPTSQTFRCKSSAGSGTLRFASMTVDNTKCGARTKYTTTPEYCSSSSTFSYYDVYFGNRKFPTFY